MAVLFEVILFGRLVSAQAGSAISEPAPRCDSDLRLLPETNYLRYERDASSRPNVQMYPLRWSRRISPKPALMSATSARP